MKFFLSLLLLGAFTISTSLEAPIENENVELIINGDESAIPENILGIDVNTLENGAKVLSEKLYPTKELADVIQLPEVVAELPDVIELPVVLPAEDLEEAAALPADVIESPVALPAELPNLAVALPAEMPGIAVALPAEISEEGVALPAEIPEVAAVLPAEIPETPEVLPVDVPETPSVLPADVPTVVEEGSNIVYKDDLVSVEVNADSGSWYSSWVSMVVSWWSGAEQQTTKVL